MIGGTKCANGLEQKTIGQEPKKVQPRKLQKKPSKKRNSNPIGVKRDKLETLSDEELVRKSQKRNQIAFEVLMERHSNYILASILKGSNFSSSEEILQRTYIKCWQRIGTFKFKSSFKTWIYRVLRNNHYDLARQEIRKKKFEVTFTDLEGNENNGKNALDFLQGDGILLLNDELPSSNLERVEKAEHLKEIFKKVKKKLNTGQEETMRLVLEEEMTYEEAARQMKCSIGTVMSRLFYARKTAQKVIKENYEKI